ncbi:MAG: hypothetical protein OEZ58_13110 [Gammaproteobacteria bacterium]|nr:hypothetical protein [Gammaproteobacteria bacterium]
MSTFTNEVVAIFNKEFSAIADKFIILELSVEEAEKSKKEHI